MIKTIKKKNWVKTLIISLGLGFFLFIGFLYFISTRISPDIVRREFVEVVEKNMPGAKVSLDELNYSLGFSLTFETKSLQILEKKTNKKILSLTNLKAKIPIWAIFFQGGDVSIELNQPEINFVQDKNGLSNIEKLFGRKNDHKSGNARLKTVAPTTTETSVGSNVSHGSSFLRESSVNIKLIDVLIRYQLADRSKGNIQLSKVVLKDLSLKKISAYELMSKVKTKMADGKKVSFDAFIVGELNLKEIIETKEVTSSLILRLSDLKAPGIATEIPSVKGNLDFRFLSSDQVSGNFDIQIDSHSSLKSSFDYNGERLRIRQLMGSFALKDFAKIMDYQNPEVNFGKSLLLINGDSDINSKNTYSAQLKFSLSEPLVFTFDNSLKAQVIFNAEVQGNKFELKSNSKVNQGVVDFKLTTSLPSNYQKIDLNNLGLINIEGRASGFELKEELIQKFLYSSNEAESGAPQEESMKDGKKQVSRKTKKKNPAPRFPKTRSNISWENITIASQPFAGKALVKTDKNTVKINPANFSFSKGVGTLKTESQFLADSIVKTKLDLGVKKLDLAGLKGFLPPKLENIKGLFTGSARGDVSKNQDIFNYQVALDVSATNGELKDLNLSDYVKNVVRKIPVIKDKVKDKEIKITENFKDFNLKGNFKNNRYELNKFFFEGVDNKIKIQGHGNVYPLSKKSKGQVDLTLIDKVGGLGKTLKENTGSNELPIRLIGSQLSLKPDYKYTLKRLAKKATKVKGKTAVKEAAKKEIEKLGDKLLKGKSKKDVEKLLKGLF